MSIKYLFTFCILSCIYTSLIGQGGIQFYGGITDVTNESTLVTPEGTSHPGWHIGADARLNEGKMYFIIGGQLHKVKFIAQEEKDYFSSDDSYTWTKFRVGLGYKVIEFNPSFFLRGHTLLSLNLISGIPDERPSVPFKYNSGTAGANLGLGFDIYNFTLDVSYELGFFKTINQMDMTNTDFLTISLGYKI